MKQGKAFGDIELSYQAKPPHRSWSIVIGHQEGEVPGKITSALERLGWRHTSYLPPDDKGVCISEMTKDGSGIFSSWIETERKKYMSESLEVLAELGYHGVPMYKLELHDLV